MDVSFQRVRDDDADALVAFLTGDDWPFHGGGRPGRDEARARVPAFTAAGARTSWVVVAGERVGLVHVHDLGDDTAMFDLRVREALRGRGVGTAAVRWLTADVFAGFAHVRRMEATTRVDNVAMRRVLLRCGYVREAHYRDGWPAADGRVHDAVGYAVLRRDWLSGTTTAVPADDLA